MGLLWRPKLNGRFAFQLPEALLRCCVGPVKYSGDDKKVIVIIRYPGFSGDSKQS